MNVYYKPVKLSAMKINKTTLLKILFLSLFVFKLAYGYSDEDDEDDILGEILVDMMVGVAIAVCETSVACTQIMHIIGTIVILITLISWICNGCRCETPTKRDVRRGATIVSSRYAAKWLVS